MKNVTLSLLFLFILFSACKKNSLSDIANRPYSQFENSTVEGAVTKVRFEDTDILINFILENDTLPDFFTTTLSVNIFGAPLNHDVIVNYEIIDTMGIKLNREFTLSDTKFIIPAGSLTGSIDITISNPEMPVDSLAPFLLKLTNVQGAELDTFYKENTVKLYKNCLLDYESFEGIYNVSIYDLQDGNNWEAGPSKIEVFSDSDFPMGLLITGYFLWNENDTLRLNLETDGTLSSPFQEQIINIQAPYQPGYHIYFYNFRNMNVTNNCIPDFTFSVTIWLEGYLCDLYFKYTFEKISNFDTLKAQNPPFLHNFKCL